MNKDQKELFDQATQGLDVGAMSPSERELLETMFLKYLEEEYDDDFLDPDEVLKQNPKDIDALVQVAFIESRGPLEYKERLEEVIEKADKFLEEDGLTNPDLIGEYWQVFETRPYMRLMYEYLQSLLDLSMYKKAISQSENILRLNESDNLGVRFILMNLYALIENEEGAMKLVETYGDRSVEFLLGLSILYFKIDNINKSFTYLKKAQKTNKNVKTFISNVLKGKLSLEEPLFSYPMGSLEQIEDNALANHFLFTNIEAYYPWAKKKLRNIK